MANQYFHGSSSASLVGTLQVQNPGLKSIMRILEEGSTTYCGELVQGIELGGVGLVGFSAVPPIQLRYAVGYAYKESIQIWNPAIGERELEQTRQLITKLTENPQQMKSRITKEGCQRKIILMERRVKVVYGFYYQGEVVSVLSEYHDEIGVPEVISPPDFTLYVPPEEVQRVKSMASEKNIVTTVKALEELYEIPNVPLNGHWALDDLIGKKRDR